ncbi:Acetylornithine deacetylase/Succinyl-diaminopimelate desuccinylase [Robiginitalea myxolifaciens]|uniref:Acetylornithine deacetylase/Succinyl-diaminopimelate desuccinylase n=1 Tax=Robiginitalea myxolifaciens TaxID=400055 RepID=A0A1I6HCH5_9FLAO|nr:M20/M25/M40 family metallo-hydrolase [Robiginitalea myxolifaciens]SFR52226.1 Acetylornithine deacetylase/Succinyl-diaminopimelate desuccinylase [Robiginitalea myxolifaciens]
MNKIVALVFLLVGVVGHGQQLPPERINDLADRYLPEGIERLAEFLKLPNIGSSPEDIQRNLNWCQQAFQEIGFETEVLLQDGIKHLLAQRNFSTDAPTMLFYLQIDGQPVDPDQWEQEHPFEPVFKDCSSGKCELLPWDPRNIKKYLEDFNPEWRIFARSSSDSKGPAVALLQSLGILVENGILPAYNIKVIMDFQEELGSPTLPDLVLANADAFEAEGMLIMDGTRPPGNLPNLTFGARGIATARLTVYGPTENLHSGQYGNYAPNPVFALSRLLGAMKDESGRVLIPGFYDGVTQDSGSAKTDIKLNQEPEALLNRLGIARPEAVGKSYHEALQYPSLNVRGLQAGWVGSEVRTIIPSQALAEIDMRLVVGTPAEKQIELLRDFAISKGFYVIDHEPSAEERRAHPKIMKFEYRIGSQPFRTPIESTFGLWLSAAMEQQFGAGQYTVVPTTGGSQPIAPFINTLGIPAVSVRISNPDNNIHGPNENLRLGNFHEGLKMCLSILTRPVR